MFRTLFSILFKTVLVLGAIFAVFSLMRYLTEQRNDYIEIYNDDIPDGEYY
ncbi:MAG: hypothetical protein GXY32_11055 [Ruminococcaceae bacterium]|nr:hypothetical protein [Oscillospiraceae bacterium]